MAFSERTRVGDLWDVVLMVCEGNIVPMSQPCNETRLIKRLILRS